MMIHTDKCIELGLPAPKSYHNQLSYVISLITQGIKLNTREARYIGIHNLHSLISTLKRKGHKHTLEHGRVYCPFTGETPSQPVDILSMNYVQIEAYKNERSREEN